MAEKGSGSLPKDALQMAKLLESMGITEYEPRVLQQLMDFMYRYTAEILQDAEAVADRAGGARGGEVGLPDVMLAIQGRATHAFVPPPPMQQLHALAEAVNGRALPEPRQRYGLRLPPEAEALLAPNYQVADPSGTTATTQQRPAAAAGAAAAARPPG